MIWTVLLIIAVSLVGIIMLIILVVLFPPIHIGATFHYTQIKKDISVSGWWMHPWIATVIVNTFENTFLVKVLGRVWISRDLKSEEKKQPDSSAEELIVKSTIVNEVSLRQQPVQEKSFSDNAGFEKESGISSKEVEAELEIGKAVTSEQQVVNKNEEESTPLFEKKPETAAFKDTGLQYDTTLPPNEEHFKPQPASVNGEENQDDQVKKGTFFQKLKKNRYFFIVKHKRWRKKIYHWLLRVVKRFFKIVTFDRVSAKIKAGVEDPSILGKIYGFYELVHYSLRIDNGQPVLIFEPVFMKYHFEGEGTFGLRTSVMKLMFPLVVAIATFPYFTTLLLFWRSRKLK